MVTEKQEPDALSVAVGKRITAIMKEKGVLQSDLAERMASNAGYVWRVTQGQQNLSLRLIGRICRALDITLVQLFEGVKIPADIGGTRAYVPKARKRAPKANG